jgi:hypothetical protein
MCSACHLGAAQVLALLLVVLLVSMVELWVCSRNKS